MIGLLQYAILRQGVRHFILETNISSQLIGETTTTHTHFGNDDFLLQDFDGV